MPSIHRPTSAVNAPASSSQLLREGWRVGLPGHIRPETEAIDRRVCKALTCSHCGKHGLEYRPFGKGGKYRVVAECPACGGEEVV